MMLCRNPYVKAGRAYGCGQCMPCRFNRRREWTHRIMLESLCHSKNAFLTLTYSPGNLPLLQGLWPDRKEFGLRSSLRPKDLQDWLKRLRLEIEPVRMRFYAVGEYGDDTHMWGRPHYHVAVFGLPSCANGITKSLEYGSCCEVCDLYARTWGKGHVFVGSLAYHSAGYIAGYVTKKMTKADDERLCGRHPEFSRMSRDPGIGVDAMWDVASELMRLGLDESEEDVPSSLRHGAKKFPLGRLLRSRLREMVGKDAKAPEATLKRMEAELSPVRDLAFENSESFKKAIVAAADGRVAQFEAYQRLFKERRTL